MRVNKLRSVMTLLLLLVGLSGIHAQGDTVSISIPISGQLLLEYDGQASILLIDTASGSVQTLVSDGPLVRDPLFSPSGSQITYFSDIYDLPPNRRNVILDVITGTQQSVNALGSRENPVTPRRWSVNENAIFYYSSIFDPVLPDSYSFELVDLDTNTLKPLRQFARYEVLTGFDLPANSTGIALSDISQVDPNPVYDPWVALTVKGVDVTVNPDLLEDPSDEANINDVILWNYQTQQMISVANILEQDIDLSSFVEWHPNGKMLGVVGEDLGTVLFRFDPTGNNIVFEVEKNTSSGLPLLWLGVEDLLITTVPSTTGDFIYLVGQLVGDQWKSTEFFRLPSQDFPVTSINLADWKLTASQEEQRQLSCLFDEGFPSRLVVNSRGQVTFTDGTPSRLRSAPGTDSEVITQMAEGTPFNVIGDPYCADDYRWWQIQLDDGTVGYAAETHMISDGAEYFLEPLEITATETPTVD